MKRILFALLLMLVFADVMLAQDATVEPIVPTIEPTPANVETTVITAPDDAQVIVVEKPVTTEDRTFERLALLAALILLVIDKISGHFLSAKLANMVPAEWKKAADIAVDTAVRTGLQRAHDNVTKTEEPWDDTLLEEGAKIIGWEFITNTDGSVTPRRIQPPAAIVPGVG